MKGLLTRTLAAFPLYANARAKLSDEIEEHDFVESKGGFSCIGRWLGKLHWDPVCFGYNTILQAMASL